MIPPRRLLVVDPDSERARRLGELLEHAPHARYDVERLHRLPDEGLHRQVEKSDAVLLNVPDRVDNRFLAMVKEAAMEVPVIVFQSREDERTARRLFGVGIEDYVVPRHMDARKLDWAIRNAQERHQLRKELLAAERDDGGRGKAIDSINEMSRLRDLSDFKTKLLNTAAHEISTPLTPIRFQTTILRRGDQENLDDRQRRALEILDRNVDRLSKLVHDVLDVARLESDNLKIRPEPMDLSQVAHETVDAFRDLARQAQVELVTELEEPLTVPADAERIAQVFFNLVSNAIKFTPEGGQVTVRTSREDDMALASVEDTGVGLKAEDFQRLFQPFSQIESDELNTPKRGGTGLGLYITQGIIEQHGGRIWCDSPGVAEGSTFSFAIPTEARPVADDEEQEPGGQSTAADDAPEPKRRGVWPFIYFHCPMCDSRDIDMRLIKNTYECNRCRYLWK